MSTLDARFDYSLVRSVSDTKPRRAGGAWQEFLLRTAEPEVRGDLELDAYLAADKETRSRQKSGPAWIPALFRPGGGREDTDVVEVTALVGDLDGGKLQAPQIRERLNGFAHIGHSSYSHSPEAPRYRVILPLARPIPPERYNALWEWLNHQLDGALDPSGRNPGHLYFLPAVPPGGEETFERWASDGEWIDPDTIETADRPRARGDAVELEDLGLPPWAVALIRDGLAADTEGRYQGDRSRALWAVLLALVKAGATDATIVAVLMHEEHALSAVVLGHAKRPDKVGRWLLPQIAKARERAAQEGPGRATAGPDERRYIPVPLPPQGLLYGPIGRWATEATEHSEATPEAAFAHMAAYAGCVLGRDATLWVGDVQHHPRLYVLIGGRTSKGRKGTSAAPTERLHHQLEVVDAVTGRIAGAHGTAAPLPATPNVHFGGLSTREGLTYCLRDPTMRLDPKTDELTVEDPGIKDKRLYVVETEFANVLAQSQRDGNTLSAALRDCWDGRDLAPLTKRERVRASAPHVCLVAHVPPRELLELVEDRQISNGFLNRYIVLWSERRRLVPFPQRTPDDKLRGWASDLHAALTWVRRTRPEMKLSDLAADRYRQLYLWSWAEPSDNEIVATLLQRAPAHALRLAMILALIERRSTISESDLECAAAWIQYAQSSVEYLWRERAFLAAPDGQDQERAANGQAILEFLRKEGGSATRTTISTKVFKGHLSTVALDDAIEHLQLRTPPAVEVEIRPPPQRGGRATTLIRLPSAP